MKKSRMMIITLAMMLYSLCYAATDEAPHEQDHRAGKLTDMAALHIQDRSIQKLQSLVKQYRQTPQEADLLYRLADLNLQRSGITFRISEGTSVKKRSAQYASSLKEANRVLTELLTRYPYYANAAMAHFKRGKAFKELQMIKQAREDFLYIDQNYQNFEYLDSALIDLTDFAQDANHHEEALTYLAKIEKMNSEYYPIALHKAAWSYYNLHLHQSSLDYLQKEINFYFDHAKNGAETAFLESAFNDLALFSFEAFNKKASFIRMDRTLDLFKKLDRNQKFFGPTVLKLAKLLKAYTLIDHLNELKKQLIEDYIQLPETSEVAMVIFQFHFERKDFNALSPLITDLTKIRSAVKSQSLDQKVEAGLSNALSELHKLVIKNKKATEIGTLVRPLISLTESVTQLMSEGNATSLLANYALAETSFELEDFSRATQKYLELLKPEYAATLEAKKITQHSLALRLLGSRYRELKKEQLVPEKLTIRTLTAKNNAASKDQISRMREWITWLDLHIKSTNAKTAIEELQSFAAFSLEANKLIYEYIDLPFSLLRLQDFALKHPNTAEGQTSITIVLDTLLKSEDWNQLYSLTSKALSIKNWNDKSFSARVTEMSADAHLRITLSSDEPELAIKRTQECIEKFKNSKIAQECEIIQAKANLKLNHPLEAEKALSHLLSQTKDALKTQSMLLLRAEARNKLGRMDQGMSDLFQYQTMTDFKDAEVTQNMLQYYWYKRDYNRLETLLKNTKACSDKNQDSCEQFRVVRFLDEGREAAIPYATAFRNTIKASKNLVSVWALIALRDSKKLPFQDRLLLLQRLANSWEQMNPLLQIHLFPTLHVRTKEALESIRISAPGIAPLNAGTDSANSIERRMRLMQDIDQTFAKIMKLNWIDLKMKSAVELAAIYERLVLDLRAIQTPEDLLKPFIKKTADIKEGIQSLQAMSVAFHAGTSGSASTLLTSNDIQKLIPEHLKQEWKLGVESKHRDYLFYLVSIIESTTPSFKELSNVVKGLILLTGDAPTEAFELVKSAPDSAWKTEILTQFTSTSGGAL